MTLGSIHRQLGRSKNDQERDRGAKSITRRRDGPPVQMGKKIRELPNVGLQQRRAKTGAATAGTQPENVRTCQLVSREIPETIRRIPGGLRERTAPLKKMRCQFSFNSVVPSVPMPLFMILPARATFFGKFDHDTVMKKSALNTAVRTGLCLLVPHKGFSVEVGDGIFRVL